MPRLRRAEQVERNHELVIEAARRVFLAKGYAGATLEQIADEAGFSKGVVYSQFESKADLFLALIERRIEERAAENERIARGRAGADALLAMLRAFERDARAEAGWQILLVEFRVVAARDPALNRRYAAAHARTIGALAAVLRGVHARAALAPRFPVQVMAELVMAFGVGFALETTANPAGLPAPHVETMLLHALGFSGRERG